MRQSRKRKCNQVREDTTTVQPSKRQCPYLSRSSASKAVKRVQTFLPLSPNKRDFVIRTLATREGVPVAADAQPGTSTNPSGNTRGTTDETRQEVVDFYLSDDVTWQAPGKKDHVIIRDSERNKTVKQTRYMLMSLGEAYEIYKTSDLSAPPVKRSKFCHLRPAHVKLFSKIPHNVCVCSYHENVRLLLKSLSQHTNLSHDTSKFLNQIVCESDSELCMRSKCGKCRDSINYFQAHENKLHN